MSRISLRDTLKFGNKFCVLPFIHHYTDVKKERFVCCYSQESINETTLTQIRTDLLNNIGVNPCNSCYKQEEDRLISSRQLANKDFLLLSDKVNQCVDDHIQGKDVLPISYDLRYSNLCNLECQICNSTVSSSIALAEGKVSPFLSYEPDIAINKNSIRIYLAGGEPFLIKSYIKVLESIENIDCAIVINTNATILTEKMLLALDKFSNVTFTVSIDGYRGLNDCLRKNSNWDTIVNNIKILAERYRGYNGIQINTVIQKDNINHLLELGQWVESQGITLWTLSELNNTGQYYYKNCKNVIIPDELFKLRVVSTSITNVNLLKKICQELTTKQI
jgi:sulfatase maturation enzyme AslB (radical SAM superfamily)